MSRSYYTRKNQRRATTGGAIDENWEELVPPEFTIATTAPAIDTVAGGRIGAHFGRIGLAWGHAIPHGVPSANALLQAQMSRRTTFSSYIPGSPSNWPWVMSGEGREHGKTLSALAVANSVATVVPFAPNPGSPPTKRRSTLGRINWLSILPEAPPESAHDPSGDWKSDTSSDSNPSLFSPRDIDTPATEALPSPKASHVPPALILAPPPRIPLLRRSVTLPHPTHGALEPRDSAQVLILDPRVPLFDSPVPLTSSTTTTSRQPQLNPSTHNAQTIIDGLSDLFDFAERQETIDQYSATGSSIDPYLYPWHRDQDFPTSVHASASAEDWVVCTPTTPSTYRTADSRERKLLIIGSSYETIAYRQASLNAPLKGVSFDAKSLTSVFRRRRYAVESLMGDLFDAGTVLNRITEFLSDAEAGDVRAIIFTGHAHRIGPDKQAAIAPPMNEHHDDLQAGWITAEEWEQTVRKSTKPGVIVLSIFASCFSGGFMQQRVSIRDLSDPATRNPATSNVPIFITFASSKEDQSAYDSIVGCPCDTRGPWRDSVWRYGDHFLRAFTLAARESNLADWQSFVKVLDEKLKQVRKIGAIFAEDPTWPEKHPQEAVYTVSRNTIPGWEDIMPDDASMIEAPTPDLITSTIDLSEAFLAHINLCGETPEITHFTSADAQ